jgi:hypothetical protein
VVEGKNSQGKTTTVESFAMLLAGGTMPDNAIHRGETEGSILARIETEVGVLVVQKTFTEDKDPALSITIEGQRGQLKPEQTILDILIDTIATKPREFFELEDKAQAEMLAKLKGFDPTELNKQRKELFDKRTEVRRDAKRELAAWEELPSHDAKKYSKLVVVSDLMEDLKARQAHNEAGSKLDTAFTTASTALEDAMTKMTRLKEEAAAAERAYMLAVEAKTEAQAAVVEFEPQETEALEKEIAQADEINSKVRDNEAKAEARTTYMKTEEEAQALDDQIDEIDREKKAALLEAGKDLPVEGLALTEDCVMLNGDPLSEAGKGERMLVATAVMMAVNKESPLKVVLNDDAESMDEDTYRAMNEMIAEADFQSLETRVLHKSGRTEGALLIEDGTLKE